MDLNEILESKELLVSKINENPDDPQNEVRKEKLSKIDQYVGQHKLQTGAYKSIARQRQSKEGYHSAQPMEWGGSVPAHQIAKETNDIKNEELTKAISQYTQVDADKIDVTSGIGIGKRFKSGLLPTPERKIEYLFENYKPEELRFVPIEGGIKPLVKQGDDWVLFDEARLTMSDVADLSREGPLMAAEIVGSIATAKATGGLSWVGKAGGLTNMITMAAGAGAARGTAAAILDTASGDLMFENGQEQEILKSSTKEGAITAAMDLGFGLVMKQVGKFIVNHGRLLPDQEIDEILDSVNRVEKSLGVEAPRTPAMAKSTAAKDVEAFDVSRGHRGHAMAEQYATGRDIAGSYAQTIKTGEAPPLNEINKKIESKIRRNHSVVMAQSARATQAEKNAMTELTNGTLVSLGRASDTSENAGKAMQLFARNGKNEATKVANQLYGEFEEAASNVIVGSDKAVSALNKRIQSLDLPKDVTDELLISHIPPADKKALRQVSDIAKNADENLGSISLHDLYVAKKAISKAANKPDASRNLREIDRTITKFFNDSANENGLAGKILAADENYKNTIGVYNKKGFHSASDVGYGTGKDNLGDADFTFSGRGTLSTMFGDANIIRNIDNWKKVLGTPEGMNQLADGYSAFLRKKAATADGSVDLDGFLNAVDDEAVSAIYGDAALKNIKVLREVQKKYNQLPSKTLDIDILEEVFKSPSGAEMALKDTISKKILARRRVDRVAGDRLLKLIREGGEGVSETFSLNPDRIVQIAIDRKLPVKELFKNLNPAEQDSFRRSAVRWLYDQASYSATGEVQKASQKKGIQTLWNPVALDKILKTPSTKKYYTDLLGEDLYKQMIDSNNMLKNYAVDSLKHDTIGLKGRVLANGGGIATYLTLPVEGVARRMLSIIDSSPTLTKLTNSTPRTDQFAAQVFPMIAASESGMAALVAEGEKDPEFGEWIRQALAHYRQNPASK